MKVTLNTGDYYILWMYEMRKIKLHGEELTLPCTICLILDENEMEIRRVEAGKKRDNPKYESTHQTVKCAEGVAFCSKLDTFSKEKGRQKSLAKALQQFGALFVPKGNEYIPVLGSSEGEIKESRKNIWQQYLREIGPVNHKDRKIEVTHTHKMHIA